MTTKNRPSGSSTIRTQNNKKKRGRPAPSAAGRVFHLCPLILSAWTTKFLLFHDHHPFQQLLSFIIFYLFICFTFDLILVLLPCPEEKFSKIQKQLPFFPFFFPSYIFILFVFTFPPPCNLGALTNKNEKNSPSFDLSLF